MLNDASSFHCQIAIKVGFSYFAHCIIQVVFDWETEAHRLQEYSLPQVGQPACMKKNWDGTALKGRSRKLEELAQVALKEHISTFKKVTHLKVDLKLHEDGHNLFVDLAIFHDVEVP